jgi:hypothetical protein
VLHDQEQHLTLEQQMVGETEEEALEEQEGSSSEDVDGEGA